MSSLPEIRQVPPAFFEDYELLGELAAGGMGVIFVARRVGAAGFERVVIVKRIHRHLLDDPEVGRLLREEARLTASLHHPNVIAAVDVVESNGEVALVFEYVESLSLSALVREARVVPPAIAARIACDTLSGLHAAHRALDLHGNHLGIVHRDISPQNVLVGRDGVARLIDFGIAKATARVAETTTLSVRGKLRYMSPEQLSRRPVDPRSDIFSFGSVLYEILLGETLYATVDEAQLALLVLMAEEPSIPAHVPPPLAAVLRKALARSPDDRFASAKDFEEALAAATVVASAMDVERYVAGLFGPAFEARREAISRILANRSAFTPGVSGVALRAAPASAPTHSAATNSRRSLELTPAPSSRTGGSTSGGTLYGSQPKRRSSMAILGLLVVSIAATAFMVRRGTLASSTAATTTTAVSVAVAVPTASAPVSTDIELVVLSDRRIETLRAPGLHRIDIDGSRAKIAVAPWSGPLVIDAQLQGNKSAHATAAADGPREVLLALEARPTPSAPQTAPTAPRSTLDINMAR